MNRQGKTHWPGHTTEQPQTSALSDLATIRELSGLAEDLDAQKIGTALTTSADRVNDLELKLNQMISESVEREMHVNLTLAELADVAVKQKQALAIVKNESEASIQILRSDIEALKAAAGRTTIELAELKKKNKYHDIATLIVTLMVAADIAWRVYG